MYIRDEQESDREAVHAINTSAFPTSAEAELVSALRQQAEPLVSLVAEVGGAVIGHIMFTPVVIREYRQLNLMGLAPMAVMPGHQGQGVGSSLVRAGLEACREIDCGAVVVLGHPEFYPRFGFTAAFRFGIDCQYDAPADAFLIIELKPGYLEGVRGTVLYHEAFNSV